MTGREIVVVLDAGPLAERLTQADRAVPEVSYARVVLAVTPALLAAVGCILRERREGGRDAAVVMAGLREHSRCLEESTVPEVYDDPVRDGGLRLAVAAGAQYYVSEDADVVALGEWKGVRILSSFHELVRELLSQEETAPVFRAASEVEATQVAEVLEAAGVDCYVAAQQVPWYDGVLVMGQGYWGDVIVFRRDLDRARRAIREAMGEAGFI